MSRRSSALERDLAYLRRSRVGNSTSPGSATLTDRSRDTPGPTRSHSPESDIRGYGDTSRPRFETSLPQTPPRSPSRGRRPSPPPRATRRDGHPRRYVPSQINSDSDSDGPSPPRLGGRRRNSYTPPAFMGGGGDSDRFLHTFVLPLAQRERNERAEREIRRPGRIAQPYYEVPQRDPSRNRRPTHSGPSWRYGGEVFANDLPSQARTYRVHENHRNRSPGDRRPSNVSRYDSDPDSDHH